MDELFNLAKVNNYSEFRNRFTTLSDSDLSSLINKKNKKDKERTLLHYAAINGNSQMIYLLNNAESKYKAQILMDSDNNTPLHLYLISKSMRGNEFDINLQALNYLIKINSPLFRSNNDEKNCITLAIETNEQQVIKNILDASLKQNKPIGELIGGSEIGKNNIFNVIACSNLNSDAFEEARNYLTSTIIPTVGLETTRRFVSAKNKQTEKSALDCASDNNNRVIKKFFDNYREPFTNTIVPIQPNSSSNAPLFIDNNTSQNLSTNITLLCYLSLGTVGFIGIILLAVFLCKKMRQEGKASDTSKLEGIDYEYKFHPKYRRCDIEFEIDDNCDDKVYDFIKDLYSKYKNTDFQLGSIKDDNQRKLIETVFDHKPAANTNRPISSEIKIHEATFSIKIKKAKNSLSLIRLNNNNLPLASDAFSEERSRTTNAANSDDQKHLRLRHKF